MHNLEQLLSDGFWLQGWFIDPLHGRFASEAGHQLHIEPKVMDVLLCLARHHGKVVSRKQLLDAVWGDVVVSEEVLTRCVSELRTALNDTARQRRFIKTIPKRGYSLIIAPTATAAGTEDSPTTGAVQAPPATSHHHQPSPPGAATPGKVDAATSSETEAAAPGEAEPAIPSTQAKPNSTQPTSSPQPNRAAAEQPEAAKQAEMGGWAPGQFVRGHFKTILAVALAGLLGLFGPQLYQAWHQQGEPTTPRDLASLASKANGSVDTTYALDVAVLPFANLSGNTASDYLGEGLAEDIRSRLMHGGGQRVAARTSSQMLSEQGKALGDVGRSLQTRFVVEGTVRLIGQQLRVTALVFATQESKVLWAESFDGHIDTMFALFDRISQQVATVLADKSPPSTLGSMAALENKPTSSAAYDNYLLGRFHWNKRQLPDLVKAEAYFRAAIAQDSQFAPAYAGLADSLILQFTYSEQEETKTPAAQEQMGAAAESAITQALAINPDDAEAHASRGLLASILEDESAAIPHYRRSVALNPNYSMARMWLGSALQKLGEINASMEQFNLALRLDPLHPAIQVNYVSGLLQQGKYAEAIAKSREFFPHNPNDKLPFMVAYMHWLSGNLAALFSAADTTQLEAMAVAMLGSGLLFFGEYEPVEQYLARNSQHLGQTSIMLLRLSLALAKRSPADLRLAATEFMPYLDTPDPLNKWGCKQAIYHDTLGHEAWLQQALPEAEAHFARSAENYRLHCSKTNILQFVESLAYQIVIAQRSNKPASVTQALVAKAQEVIELAAAKGRGGMEIELAKLALLVAVEDTASANQQLQSMEQRGWNPEFLMHFIPLYDEFLSRYRAQHGKPDTLVQGEQQARALIPKVDLKNYDI